jgi:hypothetical protein
MPRDRSRDADSRHLQATAELKVPRYAIKLEVDMNDAMTAHGGRQD